MVRLKEVKKMTKEAAIKANFNSTMVRLKVTISEHSSKQNKFQFHDGTIKRDDALALELADALFQFHDGTIKSNIILEYGCCFKVFQFHDGTIKSSSTHPTS